ncbi:universal stress protein UspB [Vibrio palustris]|uniref:Universal stress protein B n=1 Tax=Vibrio palustris TaxID=1918946 RepID=A0A1R4B7Y7_9VIBR|nr:universal stress protein UspB [Vibrio palustris]SJL85037.1 Universal stress protein B [Vibrio palustris]
MIVDMFLFALCIVTIVNIARCLSSLRSLLYVMRQAHPLLYQQVDGRGFFSVQGNFAKQIRLYHYLKCREYQQHHDEIFTAKCDRVRYLFALNVALVAITFVTAVMM